MQCICILTLAKELESRKKVQIYSDFPTKLSDADPSVMLGCRDLEAYLHSSVVFIPPISKSFVSLFLRWLILRTQCHGAHRERRYLLHGGAL